MKGMIRTRAETALVVCVNADSSVIEEQWNKACDNNNWGLQKQQSCDCQELASCAHEEAEGNCVWRTKAVGNCAVNAWDGTLEEFVGNTLEGVGKLGNEGTNTKLQDGEVNSKLEGSGHDVEEEILTWLHELVLKQELLTKNSKDDTKECCHENCSCNEVLVEDLKEAWKLDVLNALRLLLGVLGEPLGSLGCAIDAKHLLVSNGKTSAISEVLGRSNAKVGTNCPVRPRRTVITARMVTSLSCGKQKRISQNAVAAC